MQKDSVNILSYTITVKQHLQNYKIKLQNFMQKDAVNIMSYTITVKQHLQNCKITLTEKPAKS